MNLHDYAKFDAIGLAEAITRGEYSRSEIVEAAIEGIEKLNPQLNAVVIKNYENARKTTTASSSESPLAGVPFLLKDVNVFSSDRDSLSFVYG